MSSFNTSITISDSIWDEIQQKVRDTNTYVTRCREETQRVRSEIEKREQILEEVREKTKKTVNTAVEMFKNNFKVAVNDIPTMSKEMIESRSKIFDGEVMALRSEIQATIQDTAHLSSRMTKIAQVYADILDARVKGEDESSKSAQIYVDSLSLLYEQINQLDPTALEPVAFREVSGIIVDVNANIKAGRYGSALTTAQIGILKSSELLTRLIVAKEMFNQRMVEAMEQANSLKAKFDSFDSHMDGAVAFEIDGEQYEFEYDIDHWSDGRFSELREEFESTFAKIHEAQEHPISIEQLEFLKKRLVKLKQELNHCDINARNELIGSQTARETAARLYDSLKANNWELGEYGYDDDDDRKAYTMIFQDAAGNNISIVISPGESADSPNIYLEAFTEEEDHAEIVKRNLIQAVLPDEGLIVESTLRLNDCENNKNAKTFIKNTLHKTAELNAQRRKNRFGK